MFEACLMICQCQIEALDRVSFEQRFMHALSFFSLLATCIFIYSGDST